MKSASTSQQLVIEVREVPAPKQGADWWSLAPAGLAAAVAVVGWIIVERFARARERRADLRALTNSFRDTIDDILSDASAYYQMAGTAPEAGALAISIKSKLSLLPEQLAVLADAGLPIEVGDQMKQFRQAITGGEFESAGRKPSQAGSQIFVAMAASGQHLNRAVQLSLYRDLVRRGSKIWRKRGEGLRR